MPSDRNTSLASSVRAVQPVLLPIGGNDFATLIRGGYIFIDKSLLIEEFLQSGAQVTLLTRPRRFGKTLNLSMLQHFFAPRVNGLSTAGLFDELKIASRPQVMAHQGQYPVIFLSFRGIKETSFAACESELRSLLADLYQAYPELPASERLSPSQRKQVRAILNQEAGSADMGRSLKRLCEYLYLHHGRKTIVLLDEYDTPIHSAYMHGYYSELTGFIGKLLGIGLKDNPYLHKAFITGVLRIAKESLFSEFNTPKVLTVLDGAYAQYFGFTETEVTELLQTVEFATQQPKLEESIKAWYNGYQFGQEVIYNPWSIINCQQRKGRFNLIGSMPVQPTF